MPAGKSLCNPRIHVIIIQSLLVPIQFITTQEKQMQIVSAQALATAF